MCSRCSDLSSLANSGNDSTWVENVGVVLADIATAHRWPTLADRETLTMRHAVQQTRFRILMFLICSDRKHFVAVAQAVTAFWAARQRAQDRVPARLINPAGQAEPRAATQAHFAPPDSCIYGTRIDSPDRVTAIVDHAQHSIDRRVRKAQAVITRNWVLPESGAAVKRLASDLCETANAAESALAVYKSAQRTTDIRRSSASDISNYSCFH